MLINAIHIMDMWYMMSSFAVSTTSSSKRSIRQAPSVSLDPSFGLGNARMNQNEYIDYGKMNLQYTVITYLLYCFCLNVCSSLCYYCSEIVKLNDIID